MLAEVFPIPTTGRETRMLAAQGMRTLGDQGAAGTAFKTPEAYKNSGPASMI